MPDTGQDSSAGRSDARTGVGSESARRRSKRYQAIRLRLLPVRFALNLAFLIGVLAGPSQRLAETLTIKLGSWPLTVVAYFLLFSIAYSVWLLPLNYYQGHAVEKRFGLSVESASGWLIDWLKGLAVSAVIGLPAVLVVYWLLRSLPDWWWIVAGIFVTLFGILLANLAPVLIYPLFFKFEPLEDEGVRGRLEELARLSHTTFSGIYRVELSAKSTEAEAMLTGMGRTRRIILSDTLLAQYEPDEIEVVLAHELGHHAMSHLPMLIVTQAAVVFAGLFIVSVVLARTVGHYGLIAISDVANLPLILLCMTVLQTLLMPLANWWSRRLEARADYFALRLTRKPAAFISAMTKLARQNLADMNPSPLIEMLLYSHPAITRRIDAARHYADKHRINAESSRDKTPLLASD